MAASLIERSKPNVLILGLIFAITTVTWARDETYNKYFLNEFCGEYFDERLQMIVPLPISIKNPEKAPPLSTALITWTRSHRHSAFKRSCSLDMVRTKFPSEPGEFQLRITGGVDSTKDTGSCQDHVEVSVGTYTNTKSIYNSCQFMEDFSHTTNSLDDIIRIKSITKNNSLGIPFNFVVTAVRVLNGSKDYNGGCGQLFSCKNNLCVHPGVKCDGRDNCGDFSDESPELNCPPIDDHDDDHDEATNWMLLGIVLGGFIIVFLTIAAAIIMIAGHYSRRAKEKVMKEAQTETDYPEKQASIPLKLRDQDETEVKTREFQFSEPAYREVEGEAENPLYESADSSLSSHKEEK